MRDDPPIRPDDPASIRSMFEGLAPDYDRLNDVLTFGLVRGWRRAMTAAAAVARGSRALDVCTGTGRSLAPLQRAVGGTGLAVGVDFTPGMLARARGVLVQADAMRLPFPSGVFDAAVCSFALRDVADQDQVISEMARVTRPGGRVVILEIGRPRGAVLRLGFDLWFRGAVPRIAGAMGHGASHRFLVRSVGYLPEPEALCRRMEDAGLDGARWRPLSLGAAHLFWATA
ncbi:MAG TPA: class I SAM-dependent methyltransferase [Actinomycetota bacterium]